METINIDLLHEYDCNPHRGNDSQFNDLCNNLLEHGFIDPLIVNQDNVVIGGNKRLRAARYLVGQGYKQFQEVPIFRYETKSEQHLAKSCILANNHFGDYDIDRLVELIGEVDIDLPDLDVMGFGSKILERINVPILSPISDIDDSPRKETGSTIKCPKCGFEIIT